MKHPSNQQLFAYWIERRGERDAPERSDIDPGAIRAILGDSFLLAYDAQSGDARAGCTFRVAGTRLCALFGRELRGEPFASLWDAESATQMRDLVGIVAEEGIGLAAAATAFSSEGTECHFELLLLPLAHRGSMGMRLLGMLAPFRRPYWLGIWPAQPLRLGTFKFVGQPSVASLGVAIAPPAARRALMVIDGGRT
jgi:hypothetical protein